MSVYWFVGFSARLACLPDCNCIKYKGQTQEAEPAVQQTEHRSGNSQVRQTNARRLDRSSLCGGANWNLSSVAPRVRRPPLTHIHTQPQVQPPYHTPDPSFHWTGATVGLGLRQRRCTAISPGLPALQVLRLCRQGREDELGAQPQVQQVRLERKWL